jgi:hypothetical protein
VRRISSWIARGRPSAAATRGPPRPFLWKAPDMRQAYGKGDGPPLRAARPLRSLGSDLLSHSVSRAVPSALEGLTSGFGMGPGVPPPPWPPKHLVPDQGLIRSPDQAPDPGGDGEDAPRAELGTRQRARARESSPRPISTGQLHTLPCFHVPPINLVVCEGPYLVEPVGDLISRRASHLDAFSAYPFRTWPTSHAAGATTGTPEVRPPRSSRTRGSSSQISCAHSG